MKKINLKDYYPYYTNDTVIEVQDEVADLLYSYKLNEAAYYLRTYRHKAFYSLDRGDGIEYSALLAQLSPFEILEQKKTKELVYKGMAALPEKQRQRIYAHYFLGMSMGEIARAEGANKSRISRSIKAGLRSLEKFLKKSF